MPADILSKVSAGEGLVGLDPVDFGLGEGARLRDVVSDAWNEAKGHWWSFQTALLTLPREDKTATALTRESWLIPLFKLLGFGDIELAASSLIVGSTQYPISHMWRGTPLHFMGTRVDLDGREAGIRGAARLSPHSLLQQLLNRSDDHLWGVVSNGRSLRLLRDSVSLTRQAFVEFDLGAMFNGEVFADFGLLYKVMHSTRFTAVRPEDCLLERWITVARDEGIRALDQLRDGVEQAITTLGGGFLAHSNNHLLRSAIERGDLSEHDLYRTLLRLVYRLLFLFVAEDRDLLLLPEASPEARQHFERFYGTDRLREFAARPSGQGHSDLWEGFTALMTVLGRDEGEPSLGLPGLGSFLWAPNAIGELGVSSIDNEDFLSALRSLSYVEDVGNLRRVDFGSLGAEEFGSVYESLLELVPGVHQSGWSFALRSGTGSERQTTGSYYTPTELIAELLDSALDPVLERAASSTDPERAILDLKILDPAAGSGHFLVAAAHRIAKRLAEVRTGEPEPPEGAYRTAVRDVVSRCLFAVDANELAVELCKVSLWLEALEAGKPLSFLEHHVVLGDSLLGATPALLAKGIPDGAFAALTGDVKTIVGEMKRRNKQERAGQTSLVFERLRLDEAKEPMEELEALHDSDLATVRAKEELLSAWKGSYVYAREKLAADAWCAAFAMKKDGVSPKLTDDAFRRIRNGESVGGALETSVRRLATDHRFFHWHLAFPQVFRVDVKPMNDRAGWSGGFDVILGNPPWTRPKLQERRFFASRSPAIASAVNAAVRKRLIEKLPYSDPDLWADYQIELRRYEIISLFAHESGRYPLTGVGDVNTYALFSELGRDLLAPNGRMGIIVQSGLATDDTTKDFFADLVQGRSLVALYGFENESKLFPAITNKVKFCLLIATSPGAGPDEVELSFFNRRATDLRDRSRYFFLGASDFKIISPNTGTCPVLRSGIDADILRSVSSHHPPFVVDGPPVVNPWGTEFQRMFDMANDSHLFMRASELEAEGWRKARVTYRKGDEEALPLLEGKMIHLYNSRSGTYENQTEAQANKGVLPSSSVTMLSDPAYVNLPNYWVARNQVDQVWNGTRDWAIAWRDIGVKERTLIASVIPKYAVGHTLQLVHLPSSSAHLGACLIANFSSFVGDYLARLRTEKVRMSHFILKQVRILPPEAYEKPSPWCPNVTLRDWIVPRVLELAYNSWNLKAFAIDHGFDVAPFRWSPQRRPLIRAELDAAYLHLYGISRQHASHILDSFELVRISDEKGFGGYKTKELIMHVYDRMRKAIDEEEIYQTIIGPPPADPSLQVADD